MANTSPDHTDSPLGMFSSTPFHIFHDFHGEEFHFHHII